MRTLALVVALINFFASFGVATAQMQPADDASVFAPKGYGEFKPNPDLDIAAFFDAKRDDNSPFASVGNEFHYQFLAKDVGREDGRPITLYSYKLNSSQSDRYIKERLRVGYAVSKRTLAAAFQHQPSADATALFATDGNMNVVYMADTDGKLWTVFFYADQKSRRWVLNGLKEPPGSWPAGTAIIAQ